MQPQIERRSHAQRVPMDQGIVEVSFAEYGETAPADAVNIAEGGLSLRASILPEVGTEMRCAFPMPDGQSIEADCQVVWTQHSGPYAGEFGLRFVDIARLDEERIRDYVDARSPREGWDDSDPGDSDGGYVDDSDPGYAARVADEYSPDDAGQAPVKRSAIPDTIRLHIDGVASPVAACVVQATHDALVVEQVLPFLCLGTGIAAVEGGPKGKLASVELRVVDGAPRLVLTILFGDDASLAGSEPASADEARVHSTVAYAKTELRSPLDTLPDLDDADVCLDDADDAGSFDGSGSPRVGMALEDARHSSIPPGRVVDARPSYVPRTSAPVEALDAADELSAEELDELDELLDGASYVRREAPRAAAHAADDVARSESPVDRLSFALRTRARQLSERAAPVTARARALTAGGLRGVLPALRALLAQLLVLAGTLRAKAAPAMTTLGRRAGATITQLRTGQAPRTTRSGRPLRRQQSRMGASVRPGASHAPQAEAQEVRPQRRTVALSVVAFVLVGTSVWALSSDDELSAPADSATSSLSTTEAATEASPATTPVSPYVAPTPPPAPVEPVVAAPAAPAGPTPGPLAEPTYPTLGEERPQEPGTVPSDSPYAEGTAASAPVQEGRTFGAESVSNGRSFEITMSVPIRTLRGRAEGNGFVVDIPDALAMSGARGLSRSNPTVARSHILNHGDHSTLTVEFVAGQSPAYRVSTRGNALQIEIAR